MVPKPLPTFRVVLEELYSKCTTCLTLAEKVTQRDQRRVKLYWRLADGEISISELRRHFEDLDRAAEATQNEYIPHLESLWPYCEASHVRKARFLLTFGGEAVADAYEWIPRNPYFANMVAVGYAMAARGQVMHVSLLRKLQNELIDAIGQLGADQVEPPLWNPDTGKLIYRGKTVRTVRVIAARVRPILDAFQSARWPNRIAAPSGLNDQTLREAIKVLNNGLKDIRFRADGTSEGVIWETR
jgi:hypothetical protein